MGGGEGSWGGGGRLCVLPDFRILLIGILAVFFDLTILYPVFRVYPCIYLGFLSVTPLLRSVLLCVSCDINLCVL